jgi:hypothetical protein
MKSRHLPVLTVVRLRGLAFLALLILVPAAAGEKPKTVTLDVKDEEIHDILRSMQRQCAIRNLVIDPGVEGRGTFLFRDLPCPTAFEVVASTMSLRIADEGSSVVTVRRRQ